MDHHQEKAKEQQEQQPHQEFAMNEKERSNEASAGTTPATTSSSPLQSQTMTTSTTSSTGNSSSGNSRSSSKPIMTTTTAAAAATVSASITSTTLCSKSSRDVSNNEDQQKTANDTGGESRSNTTASSSSAGRLDSLLTPQTAERPPHVVPFPPPSPYASSDDNNSDQVMARWIEGRERVTVEEIETHHHAEDESCMSSVTDPLPHSNTSLYPQADHLQQLMLLESVQEEEEQHQQQQQEQQEQQLQLDVMNGKDRKDEGNAKSAAVSEDVAVAKLHESLGSLEDRIKTKLFKEDSKRSIKTLLSKENDKSNHSHSTGAAVASATSKKRNKMGSSISEEEQAQAQRVFAQFLEQQQEVVLQKPGIEILPGNNTTDAAILTMSAHQTPGAFHECGSGTSASASASASTSRNQQSEEGMAAEPSSTDPLAEVEDDGGGEAGEPPPSLSSATTAPSRVSSLLGPEAGLVRALEVSEAEEEQRRLSLPIAVAQSPSGNPQLQLQPGVTGSSSLQHPHGRKMPVWIFLLIATILAAIVIGITTIVVTQINNNDHDHHPEPMEDTDTKRETTVRQSLERQIGSTLFLTSASQLQALEWILHDDPLQLVVVVTNDADHRRLLQRFLAVDFYFATSQDHSWLACNPPFTSSPGKNNNNNETMEMATNNPLCYYQANYAYTALQDSYAHEYSFLRDQEYQEVTATRWLSEYHECQWAGLFCNEKNQIHSLHLGELLMRLDEYKFLIMESSREPLCLPACLVLSIPMDRYVVPHRTHEFDGDIARATLFVGRPENDWATRESVARNPSSCLVQVEQAYIVGS